MNPTDGFIDLRLNRQEGQNQESFWPSFTDIMTVIVMIFMIAMVVLLLRNIELVNQLRATMEAERTAMELAKTTGEEKESLALKLISAENEISMLRIRMMRMDEQSQKQVSTIDSQSDRLAQLNAEKEELTLRRDQLISEKYIMEQRLKKAKSTISSQQQNIETLQQNIDSTEQELSNAQQQISTTQEQLANARQQFTNTQELLASIQDDLSSLQEQNEVLSRQVTTLMERYGEQSQRLQEAKLAERTTGRAFNTLRGEYDELLIQYERLVRPARSAEGRYLVEIRYAKVKGVIRIEYKSEEEPGYRKVTQTALEAHLDKLKASKTDGLYIKLIFPEDSGLTFNEAWGITSRLHSRYDYYFQESEPTLIPLPVTPE